MALATGPASSATLADSVGWHPRAIRRRLRRLIRDGYVFSPERGRYRITSAGRAVMEPAEPIAADDDGSGRRLLRRRRGQP